MAVSKLKRSIAISFLDDPYLAILFKRLFDRNIKDEVDEVLIQINGKNEDIIAFIHDLWIKDARRILTRITGGETVKHGEALNELYELSSGDIFITLDSDNFIYRKGIIDKFCDKIEKEEFDFVISKGPMMSFLRKKELDKMEIDFREKHIGEKFRDTMEIMIDKMQTDKTFHIPIDDLPYYEHIGRMSAFPIYVEDCWFDTDTGLGRAVRKLFGRANRVGLIKYIYEITKKEFPDDKYNAHFWKVFLDVCEDVGHKQVNIDKIIEETIKPKLKEYE